MRLTGLDHVTGITADGQRCLDFYAGILGLPFLARERDFEAPYSHLIRLGRQPGRPDGILRFIEAPGMPRGFAGNGMAHLLRWSVRHRAALGFWQERLTEIGIEVRRSGGREDRLAFADPEGLMHELAVEREADGSALALASSAIPRHHAIVRLRGVRAYGRERVPSADILAGRLGFRVSGRDSFAVGSGEMSSDFAFDAPPAQRARLGAGTVHHVAWATDGSLPAWRQRVIGMGCAVTPVIDRRRCRAIYFREPSGVLFEIAVRVGSREVELGEAAALGHRRISPRVDPRVHAGARG